MKSLIRRGRQWEAAPAADQTLVETIQASLTCGQPFATILAQRGGEGWERLIDPGVTDLHSPFLMMGMDRAVDRLMRAKDNGERVFIHGDFDVDGLSGAAVLYKALLPLFPPESIKVDVGDRDRGHGLSRSFVRRVVDEGFSLVITADCGIANVEEIALLREAGVETVVTDHHLPQDRLPEAVAILDPHQDDDKYPNRDLAGVGVAYKLVSALYERWGHAPPHHLLDLVAIGTIADLVPLANGDEVENRAMVQEGFARLAEGEGSSFGLSVLMKKLSVNEKKITASDIGYVIGPKLNAANRAGDPKVAFLLLTTGEHRQAEYLTEILLDYNRDRELAQTDLISQAREVVSSEEVDPEYDGLLFVSGKYWNEGILGLVASSLSDRYDMPAIIVSKGDRISRASCRSVKGFDMAACLDAHADLLVQYGGHEMAAGFSVTNDRLDELRRRLLDYAHHHAPDGEPDVERFDVEVSPLDVDMRLYTSLRSLSPYGPGNPAPRFLLTQCRFNDLSLVGARKQHLKGKALQDGHALPFIAFRMGEHIDAFEDARDAAVVFRTGFDDWQGEVQLQAIDLVEES